VVVMDDPCRSIAKAQAHKLVVDDLRISSILTYERLDGFELLEAVVICMLLGQCEPKLEMVQNNAWITSGFESTAVSLSIRLQFHIDKISHFVFHISSVIISLNFHSPLGLHYISFQKIK